jgi:hypothetical protein
VLGPERSGASAWAELIVRWGAYPGEQADLPQPGGLNPHGRWEYGSLWDLLERIGGFADGVSWWDENFPAIVAAKADDQELRADAQGGDRAEGSPGPQPTQQRHIVCCRGVGGSRASAATLPSLPSSVAWPVATTAAVP